MNYIKYAYENRGSEKRRVSRNQTKEGSVIGSKVIKFRGAGLKIEVNKREEGPRRGMPQEMRYLSVSRFVEIENSFLKSNEDRIGLIVDLFKKEHDYSGAGQTVAGMRRLPSSSKYRRMAKQADCKAS